MGFVPELQYRQRHAVGSGLGRFSARKCANYLEIPGADSQRKIALYAAPICAVQDVAAGETFDGPSCTIRPVVNRPVGSVTHQAKGRH